MVRPAFGWMTISFCVLSIPAIPFRAASGQRQEVDATSRAPKYYKHVDRDLGNYNYIAWHISGSKYFPNILEAFLFTSTFSPGVVRLFGLSMSPLRVENEFEHEY